MKKPKLVIKPVTRGKKERTTTLRVLRQARAIVAGEVKEATWKKGVWIDTKQKGGTSLACFCAEGAIQAAVRGVKRHDYGDTVEAEYAWGGPSDHSTEGRAKAALSEVLPEKWNGSIPEWNDHKNRTRAQVVKAFDRAIARLSEAA